MNSRRRISALQRFVGKTIAIRDALEPVLMVVSRPLAAAGEDQQVRVLSMFWNIATKTWKN
jgi:hypothetical protein